jgi:hypothetical protein
MRTITSLQGSVAIKYSPDEATPDVSILTRDVVAFLGETYEFSLKPDVPAGLMINPQPFVFQAGKVTVGEHTHPINQLTVTTGGLIVTGKDTDIADVIAEEIISKLDEIFGFKIQQSIRTKYYVSNLSVEFNADTRTFAAVEKILNEHTSRPSKLFEIKRLAFGAGDAPNPFTIYSIDDIPNTDFLLERRPSEPYDLNRYFASGPMMTRDLEHVLKLIEVAMQQN